MVRTPCQPGAATERDQHRAGRYDLLSTPFETFERNIREQLMAVLGPGGFDAKRDTAAIAVNRCAHGYAYDYNPLHDPWHVAPTQPPHVIGRPRCGRHAIAPSESGTAAATDCDTAKGPRAR